MLQSQLLLILMICIIEWAIPEDPASADQVCKILCTRQWAVALVIYKSSWSFKNIGGTKKSGKMG